MGAYLRGWVQPMESGQQQVIDNSAISIVDSRQCLRITAGQTVQQLVIINFT